MTGCRLNVPKDTSSNCLYSYYLSFVICFAQRGKHTHTHTHPHTHTLSGHVGEQEAHYNMSSNEVIWCFQRSLSPIVSTRRWPPDTIKRPIRGPGVVTVSGPSLGPPVEAVTPTHNPDAQPRHTIPTHNLNTQPCP